VDVSVYIYIWLTLGAWGQCRKAKVMGINISNRSFFFSAFGENAQLIVVERDVL
jgi:hypothetical protein